MTGKVRDGTESRIHPAGEHARSATPKVGTIPVSVIIMTLNEERVLDRTLESVRDFDQVFVVDSRSTDATLEIAKAHDVEVVQFSWNGGYPRKKEWSLLNLPFRHDWVLYLDADELVSPQLAAEISRAVSSPEASTLAAFDVELDYYFLGRLLKHGHRVTKRALIDRTRSHWPHVDDTAVANMWEVEGHYQPVLDGEAGQLKGRLQHDDIDPMYDYFSRHNRYSDWEAWLQTNPQSAEGIRTARSTRGQRYATVPLRPVAFFFYSYVLRRGFLDGGPGLHYALAHAFYFWQIHVKQLELTAQKSRAR